MMKREFTNAEITYLRGLSAVSTVTPTRIIYSEKFKRRFIREHRNGKRPSEIFREAGLPVVIIGRKRIERCTYRWTKDGNYKDTVSSDGEEIEPQAVGRDDDELLMELKDLLEIFRGGLEATERILDTIREEPHASGKKASEDTGPAKRSEEDGRPGGVVTPMT